MIVTRRCSYFAYVLLRYASRSCVFQTAFARTHKRISLNSLSCRFCQCDAVIPRIAMNNPARTSTVVLENYYVQVANFLKDPSYKLVKSFFKTNNGLWACDISVKWPTPNQFHAEQSKKTEAARIASWLAIQWLQNQNKIDNEGRPLLVQERTQEVDLNVSSGLLEAIQTLSMKYVQEIRPFYEQYENEHKNEVRQYFDDFEFPSFNISNEDRDTRDDFLACKLREMPARCPLPIDEFGAQIVQMVESNRVVVIKGATGSGKTTRVPQLILDHYIRNGVGTNCNIMVTQPRRISAIALATRIASERSENLGFSLGHHVRFSVCYPPAPGTIVFVSSGMLLQRMLLDPMLQNISHVIIDEAHERDLNIDLLLMLTRELLRKNDKIRIVIMSATINAEFFQQYYNDCPAISIPGSMYNVQTHYIDDQDMSQYFGKHGREYDERDIDDNLIMNVVQWIHRNRPAGAILVFLPGWSDISHIENILQENGDMFVLIAHSRMKIEQQELIFQEPPLGRRKIILATNIAESSITIPDVVYVVDSGLVKEVGTSKRGIKGLTNVWISKATSDQRLGRAGRVSEGECFRLYSKKKYESFDQYPTPEIMRVSLESLLMRIKMYLDDKLICTLYKFPNTPPMHAVMNAIKYLQQINVFDSEENLTPLGRRIATFGLHPLLSVSLVYSVFFKCFDSMLFITSNLNGDASVFPVGSKSSDRRNLLSEIHPTNDILATYRVYNKWRGDNTKENYTNFNMKSLETFRKVLRLNLDYLFKAHLVAVDDILRYDTGEIEGDVETLATPVLFAATGRLAANTRPYEFTGKVNHKLTTLDGLKVQVASDSVNFKNPLSSPFLTFYNINTTEEGFLRIFDTAQISPSTVLLFAPMLPITLPSSTPGKVKLAYPSIDLHIEAGNNELMSMLHFREMIQYSMKFFISHYNAHNNEPLLVTQFKEQLIYVLRALINESSKS